jgi:hypothetical protein
MEHQNRSKQHTSVAGQKPHPAPLVARTIRCIRCVAMLFVCVCLCSHHSAP